MKINNASSEISIAGNHQVEGIIKSLKLSIPQAYKKFKY